VAKERSMALEEELRIFCWNAKREASQLYDRVKQSPLTSVMKI